MDIGLAPLPPIQQNNSAAGSVAQQEEAQSAQKIIEQKAGMQRQDANLLQLIDLYA